MKTIIKTGDTAKVISGDHKGKIAKVIKTSPRDQKAFLEGIGIKSRHMKATQYQKAGKKDIHVGIHMSNLKLEKPADKPAAKKEKK